jgi:hypothetical protein
MGLGQPDVQRHQAGLGAEAEEGQEKRGRGPERGHLGIAHVVEGICALAALQDAEAEQQGDRTDVGDQQVEEAGAADVGDLVVGGDQEIGGQGHDFPSDHEGVGIISEQHQRHARQEQVIPERQQAGLVIGHAAEITHGVDRYPQRRRAEQEQEEAGKRVQAQMEGQVGQADGQDEVAGRQEQGRTADQGHGQRAEGAERKHQIDNQAGHLARQQAGAGEQQPVQDDAPGPLEGDQIKRGHGASGVRSEVNNEVDPLITPWDCSIARP